MYFSSAELKPLLVASDEINFGSHSGYSILANYIRGCSKIFTTRKEYRKINERIINKLVRNFAISDWYRLSSAKLEWLVWREFHNSSYAPIHFLWGERDLGYIDLFINLKTIPLCATFHTCSDDLPSIIHPSSRNRLKKLAAIFIMSETQRAFFEECGVHNHKIHCVLHGVDTNFFQPKNYNKVNEPFTVLSVGNFRRNFPYLRQVFQKLRSNKNIKFKVVSISENSHYFSDLGNVEFISNISDSYLLELYQSASCQIISVENATANNALIEALACGLPVIAEKIGGIPEYVNNRCSTLTDVGDIQSTVRAILELSQSPSQLINMSKAARERALELSWFNVAQKMEEIYINLVRK